PAAVKWLERHGVDVDDLDEPPKVPRPRSEKVIVKELGERANVPLDSLAHLSLTELTQRYGTGHETVGWVKARKELAAARRQELLLDKVQRQLLPASVVDFFYEYLDALTRRLHWDAAPTIASRLRGMAESKTPLEELVAVVRDQHAQHIRLTRNQIAAAMAGADPAAQLKDAPPRAPEDPLRVGAGVALAELAKTLPAAVAPKLVEVTLQAVARAAAGPTWNAERFAEVMATHPQLAPEAERMLAIVIAAHIEQALTRVITDADGDKPNAETKTQVRKAADDDSRVAARSNGRRALVPRAAGAAE